MAGARAVTDDTGDKRNQILDAALRILARSGIGGLTMRAVAKEASVALGLVNYYFETKHSLVSAALERIGSQDLELVAPMDAMDPQQRLTDALARVVDADLLNTDYIGLRLQLWSLAGVDPVFGQINQTAQSQYRQHLASLIAAARPNLSSTEVNNRASDILVVQNGMWLTSILIPDPDAIERGVQLCRRLAFD